MKVLATLWCPVSLLESRIQSTFYSTTNISHRDTLNKWQIANFALDQLWDHFFNIPIVNQPYMWNTQGMCLPTQDAGTAAWLGLHGMRAFSHTVLYRLTNVAIYSEHSWVTGCTRFITVSEKNVSSQDYRKCFLQIPVNAQVFLGSRIVHVFAIALPVGPTKLRHAPPHVIFFFSRRIASDMPCITFDLNN